MVQLSSDFWPLFWAIFGGGAVVTAAACLVIAIVPSPHLSLRAHRAQARGRRPHRGIRPHHGIRPHRHAHA